MTAIDKYLRLESTGQWREGGGAREVLVSFGNATLVLSGFDESPLAHWALAAIQRISLKDGVATYSPDAEGFETLEIDDSRMIEAISQVSRMRPSVSRTRNWGRWATLVFVGLAVVVIGYFAPSALRGQALRMTTNESARQLGWQMASSLNMQVCHTPMADNTLLSIEKHAFPNGDFKLQISRTGPPGVTFPGGLILVNSDTLHQFSAPEQLASWATKQAEIHPPLDLIFAQSSLPDIFTYVTSGTLPPASLAAAAEMVIATTQSKTPVLRTEEIPARPIVSAPEWAALQQICQE